MELGELELRRVGYPLQSHPHDGLVLHHQQCQWHRLSDIAAATAPDEFDQCQRGWRTDVLNVFITEQGLSLPVGSAQLLSGFTANLINGAVTSVVEQTLLSTTNALFSGTQMATATFTAIGSTTSLNSTPPLAPFYSETAIYTITTTGVGNVNDTINISDPVPEPATLGLFGTGLLGLSLIKRRRRS